MLDLVYDKVDWNMVDGIAPGECYGWKLFVWTYVRFSSRWFENIRGNRISFHHIEDEELLAALGRQ